MLDTAERQRLEALHALRVLDTPPEERFDRVTRLAQRMFQVPMVAVSFIDDDRQWFKSRIGLGAPQTSREDAFCNHAIRQQGPFVVTDASLDERFADNPNVTGDPHVRFYAAHPVVAPGGEAVGALCIIDTEPRELTAEEADALRDLAGFVDHELARRDELDRAERVQQGLLPRRGPNVPGYDVAGGCIPATQVGGDFFDWYPIDDTLQLTIADVMGKGVGSAIIGATVRAVLRSTSRAGGVAESVALAARGLAADLEETSAFVTMFTARLDPASGDLSYVDAGHGLTLLVDRAGQPRLLPSDDLPLGVDADAVWDEHHLTIEPGDTVISVSDGLLDFFADAGEVFDAACTVVQATTSAQDVIDEITRFTRARRAHDDVTALVVRRRD